MHTLILSLLILPIPALGLILAARRRRSMPHLSRNLVFSGAAGAILTALVVFMTSTVPIAPYESGADAWDPVLRQTLLSLYTGFGVGVLAGAALICPLMWIKASKQKHKPGQPNQTQAEDGSASPRGQG